MNPTPDIIDKYLRNELTASEASSLESAMAKDSVLKEQVAFDQSIVSGLSDFRKAELKTRLNAIDVSGSGMMGQVGNNVLMKTVGALVTASVIGVGAYVYLGDIEKSFENESKAYVLGEPNHPVQDHNYVLNLSEIEDILSSFDTNSVVTPISKEKTSDLVPAAVETEIIEEFKDFNPTVEIPVLGDVSDGKSLVIEDVKLRAIQGGAQIREIDEKLIDVNIDDSHTSETLSYKYFDGKLFLYGEFKSSPYEILEINRSSEKRLYLFYKDEFYTISSGDEVKSLDPITNTNLLNELRILRNNKL